MEKRKSFVFFTDWHRVLQRYPMHLRCKVYDAIIVYAASGEEPAKLEGEALMAFNFIREDIDRNNAKYEATCRRRRENVKKRWEKNKNTNDTNVNKSKSSIQTVQVDTNLTDNDNENGNENDINLNDNNNKSTTTKKKSGSKILKVEEGGFLKMASEAVTWNRGHFFFEFWGPAREADNKKLTDLYGEGATDLADRVMDDWEKKASREGGLLEHSSIREAFQHMERQMNIEFNVQRRKAERASKQKKESTRRGAKPSAAFADEAAAYESGF